MRDVWVHIHIPKCGGSTFREILKQNHGLGFLDTSSVLNNYQYTSDQVLEILDHHPACTCLTGHKLSTDLPYDCQRYRLSVSTFVRDPVDRFISHYFYHRHHTDWLPEAKEMLLDEYIDWALRDGHQQMYVNGQTRFLTGTTAGESLDSIKLLTRNRTFLLLPLSRFNRALLVLAKLFPNSFTHLSTEIRNVSTKDQEVTVQQRDRIMNYCNLDTLLCREAEDLLDRLTRKAFTDEAEYHSAMEVFERHLSSPQPHHSFLDRLRNNGSYLLRKLADTVGTE